MVDSVEAGLVQEFIDESEESLQTAESCLLGLEAAAQPLPLVQELFRVLHSLKGNAALFGCEAMKVVAHDAEHLLDHLRQTASAPSPNMVDTLLKALDFFGDALRAMRQGQILNSADQRVEGLRTALSAHLHGARSDADPLLQAVAEIDQLIKEVDDRDQVLAQRLFDLRQHLHPADGEAGASNGGPLPRLRKLLREPIEDTLADDDCVLLEGALAEWRDGAQDATAQTIAAEAMEGYEVFSASVGVDEALRHYLLERIERAHHEGRWAWLSDQEDASNQVNRSDGAGLESGQDILAGVPSNEIDAGDHHKSMRVSEEHIDTFLAYVGDLLVIGDTFNHLQRRVQPDEDLIRLASDFRRANETFQVLSSKLQSSIMAIRQLPGEVLLRRAPRLVRDVAQSQGKQVTVLCEGADLRLDKSLVELLDAPLTHLLRNAVDHGLEPPEQRCQAQPPKSESGTITVSLKEVEHHIELRVSDDGRGLDHDGIRRAARARHLIREDQELDQEAIVQLIFASGMSTAQAVSDISGRGVGLDVVHANIVAAGGEVSVESEQGSGTTFAIRLPKSVTTQIIMGFLVAVGEHVLVLPMDRIRDSLRYDRSQLHRVSHGRYCLSCHGKTLPAYPLQAIFDDQPAIADLLDVEGNHVAVRCETTSQRDKDQQCVLIVDRVIGVQQVVLRSIDGMSVSSKLISGGALMGDGSVSLIVDVDALCSCALGEERAVRQANKTKEATDEADDEESCAEHGQQTGVKP